MNRDVALAALDAARMYQDRFDMDCWTTVDFVRGDDASPPEGARVCFGTLAILQAVPAGTLIDSSYVTYPGGLVKQCWNAAAKALGLTRGQTVIFYLPGLKEVERAIGLLLEDDTITGYQILEAVHPEAVRPEGREMVAASMLSILGEAPWDQ